MIKFKEIKERIVNSKYFATVVTVIIVLSFIFLGFCIYFTNIKTSGQIARAKQALYQATYTDKSTITFKFQGDNTLSSNDQLVEKFYVFSATSKEGKTYDVKYLVDKKNFKVYIYDKQKMLIPYDDYINQDSILGQYFAELKDLDYKNIPAATRNYLDNKGGYDFLNKVSRILDDVNEESVKKCGGVVDYVDYILNGASQKQLNDQEFWNN